MRRRTGAVVGVVVTDTAGRAWREGQTDIAVGAAGLRVLDDHAGRVDSYGNPLAVTAPAVADEIASAAELAQGKLGGRPLALLRGRADLVLPADDDGPGAAALLRAPERDMFGYGAREAVVAALAAQPDEAELRDGFGGPAAAADVADALTRVLAVPVLVDAAGVTAPVADVHAARASSTPWPGCWDGPGNPRGRRRSASSRVVRKLLSCAVPGARRPAPRPDP
ncbi:coenzyme F420-0:L-glutamate ligase [Nocardioides zeae]